MTFSPEWHALGREAELAGAQIALGATALGRANHARIGDYTMAFFGLAIGLERMGKLIVLADYAIEHGGKFPDNKFLKHVISHDLGLLLDHCESVSSKRAFSHEYSKRPNDGVHQGIIQTLSEFAKQTRYYNLDFLTGSNSASRPEPVEIWWKRVGEPILARHYTARQRAKDAAVAKNLDKLLRGKARVIHHSETGDAINDIAGLTLRGGATRVVQKYGRLYVLQIVRWLTCMIFELAHEGAYTHGIEPLSGREEPFKMFLNDDSYFRTRKTWAIYF
jgi:hypothetical protein